MDPKEKKYILENIGRKSEKDIAAELGLKERKVLKFIKANRGHAKSSAASASSTSPIALKYIYRILPAVLILLATFISYSNLILRNAQGNLTHMIRWDVFDYSYPMFIYASDCIRNGVFPLWNPYLFGGAPFSSNPQTCLFNPINTLIILFNGYSLEALQFQVFAIFFIAGMGMYFCLKNFSVSRSASLVGAVTFLGCGFFVGNTQHFPHINMLAVLPFAFMSLNNAVSSPNLGRVSWGALAITLLAFGGYPSLLVNALYMLFLFGILKIFFIDAELELHSILKKALSLGALFALGLLAAAVLLIPAFEHTSLSTRAVGLSLESIRIQSLPLSYLSSMWFPFLANHTLPNTAIDITLRNCAIGIIGLYCALYYLLFNKNGLSGNSLPM